MNPMKVMVKKVSELKKIEKKTLMIINKYSCRLILLHHSLNREESLI